jgi:hypothetical protein
MLEIQLYRSFTTCRAINSLLVLVMVGMKVREAPQSTSSPVSSIGLLPAIKAHEPPIRSAETAVDRLLKLDSWTSPGLTEADFRGLFAKCRCGLVMTRRVFQNHVCVAPAAPVIIDLTLDDGDNSWPVIIDLTGDASGDD